MSDFIVQQLRDTQTLPDETLAALLKSAAHDEALFEAADAVLISNDLRNVPAVFALSRKTMRIIRQNLFWAFAYNALGIPLAAGLFEAILPFAHVSPAFCAAAMGASSVTVVLNALRLKFS